MGILDSIYRAGQVPGTDTTGQKIGIMKAIGSLLAPQAGSFLSAAASNPRGIVGAHQAQQDYETGMQNSAQAATANDYKLQDLIAKVGAPEYLQTPQGAVFAKNANGVADFSHPAYTPPERETDLQKNIKVFEALPEGPLKELFKRALPGAALDPVVVENKAKVTAKYRPPRAAGGHGGGLTANKIAELRTQAATAIANGADPVAVTARLKTMGVN